MDNFDYPAIGQRIKQLLKTEGSEPDRAGTNAEKNPPHRTEVRNRRD